MSKNNAKVHMCIGDLSMDASSNGDTCRFLLLVDHEFASLHYGEAGPCALARHISCIEKAFEDNVVVGATTLCQAILSVEHKCRISFVERIPCTMRSNAASAAYELAAFEHDESTNTESDRSVAALLNFSQLVIFVATRSDPRVGFEKLRAHYFSGLSDELKGLYTKVETRYLASISSSTSSTAAGPGQPRAPNFANIISNVIGRMLHPGPSTSVSAATPRSQNEGSDPDLD
ncbi:hypothetical protein DI09_47p110 [Mitosporidium daphniae]|uniref:Uncharacterized protein n=1 Tax=Mitosporidium daphniae TaxID=1485682 RepID=A0A098VPT2_9MICR|nr:uncharacterized protein DI09_47p110 [Mitosporidium daphniae]KGG51033.1 hypothetical protein DI09_47p110 [Mitosporidium daphniae]|eukprot:XP_013237460.1 uncharacterized protein DI09_47p110 [Mitosporidium daphniae]